LKPLYENVIFGEVTSVNKANKTVVFSPVTGPQFSCSYSENLNPEPGLPGLVVSRENGSIKQLVRLGENKFSPNNSTCLEVNNRSGKLW